MLLMGLCLEDGQWSVSFCRVRGVAAFYHYIVNFDRFVTWFFEYLEKLFKLLKVTGRYLKSKSWVFCSI